jgi:hypothetical protein
VQWLRVLVRSAGHRLLFFPGFDSENGAKAFRYEAGRIHEAEPVEFNIDHMSLDADRRSTHLTAARFGFHYRLRPAVELSAGCVRWFGLNSTSPAISELTLGTGLAKLDAAVQ